MTLCQTIFHLTWSFSHYPCLVQYAFFCKNVFFFIYYQFNHSKCFRKILTQNLPTMKFLFSDNSIILSIYQVIIFNKKGLNRKKVFSWKMRDISREASFRNNLQQWFCAEFDKLCAQWRVFTQHASEEVFACTKLRARKLTKTSLSSSPMLFKVVSYFCVWKQTTKAIGFKSLWLNCSKITQVI